MSLTGTTPEDFLGETVGGYTLARVLGTGSTGIVFLGVHPEQLTEDVAIKICLPPIQYTAEERAIFQARFLREAEVVQRLYHPHIVPVLQRGVEGGSLYTIFRYMQGGTLADKLSHYPAGMDLGEIVHITTQLAAALDTAHNAGVVHRDIKPTNIFFDRPEIFAQQQQFSRYDDAYLGDFGIVYLLDQSRITLTTQGQVLGTPSYMSPEQANGASITPATDIYSLGIVVYEMITGQLPFDAAPTLQLLLQIVQMPPPLPRHRRPDLPEAAEAVVIQAIAKDPALRFASAGAFAAALAQSIANQPTPQPDNLPLAVLASPTTDAAITATARSSAMPSAVTTESIPIPTPLFPRTGPLPAPPLLSFVDGKPGRIPRPEPDPKATTGTAAPSISQRLRSYVTRENMLVFGGAMLITLIGILVFAGHHQGTSSLTSSARATATMSTTPLATTTSGATTTPLPSQTASATAIAGKPVATPPTHSGSSIPPSAPGQPTVTATTAPPPMVLYDFENGQIWQKLGPQITSIVTSTDKAFDGTHSIEVKVTGLTTTSYPEAFGNQAEKIPTNAILSEAVYLPAGTGDIKAQAYVIVQGDPTFYSSGYVALSIGGWTTLRFTLPSQTFNQTTGNIGVQFFAANGTVNGSLYIDHVEFTVS